VGEAVSEGVSVNVGGGEGVLVGGGVMLAEAVEGGSVASRMERGGWIPHAVARIDSRTAKHQNRAMRNVLILGNDHFCLSTMHNSDVFHT
jgi:hypothetical protein